MSAEGNGNQDAKDQETGDGDNTGLDQSRSEVLPETQHPIPESDTDEGQGIAPNRIAETTASLPVSPEEQQEIGIAPNRIAKTTASLPVSPEEQQEIGSQTTYSLPVSLEDQQEVGAESDLRRKKSEDDEKLIRLALHRNPYFTCMDEEQIERFIRAAQRRTYRPGEAIILEGCKDDRDFEHTTLDPGKDSGLAEVDDLLLLDDDSHNAQEDGVEDEDISEMSLDYVPPPSSGSKPCLYIIKEGNADVLYHSNFNPVASLGKGTLFGEGGFLFGRQHSASIVASGHLTCWVVDFETFLNDVLNSENLKKLFSRHAHRKDTSGNLFMTMDDFVKSCLQDEKPSNQPSDNNPAEGLSIANAYNNILQSSALSQYRDNRIYLSDFSLFYLLISRPDPEVDIAFLLMDRHKTGSITKADFHDYLSNLPFYFNPESEFVQRYFGYGQTVRLYQFSQFLADLQKEMGRQAFFHEARQYQKEFDSEGVFLPAAQFVELLKSSCGWRLPAGVVDRLESLYTKGPVQSAETTAMASIRAATIKGQTIDQVTDYSTRSVLEDMEQKKNRLGTRYFSYIDYIAFQEVLGVLPGIYNLIDRACEIRGGPISADDLKVANRVLGLGGRLSRRQVDIVFQLFDLDRDGYISTEDAFGVCGLENALRLEPAVGRGGKLTFAPAPRHDDSTEQLQGADAEHQESGAIDISALKPHKKEHFLDTVLNQVTHFILSSVAGGIGIVTVYPLDLVKTRMMNQRIGQDGKRMYLQSFDCLKKTVQFEGLVGLYRGLLPPLLAVGPEKFIKFTVNDMLKSISDKDDGKANWVMEAASGACAGACQLLVTNPLEITKIRMQLQGETARLYKENGFRPPKAMSFSAVAADLGLSGLYKGAQACLLRDIPFGAIYFPAYSVFKDYLVNKDGYHGSASASHILLAGTLAGIPASFLTTPADLIKTRLQVLPRPGEVMYNGIGDCFRKVYEKEGPTAFFKGSVFRVCRIAPQFGISLLGYEKLSQLVGQGLTNSTPPTNAPVDPTDYRTAFNLRGLGEKSGDIDNLVRNLNIGFKGLNDRDDKS